MKNIIGSLITVIFVVIFIGMMSWIGKMNKGQQINLKHELETYKPTYLSYEFKGKIIDIKREDRVNWIYVKSSKKIPQIQLCCKNSSIIESYDDNIVKINFNGMLKYPNYHIDLKKGAVIYKNKNSSVIFYQYEGKTYLLSDIFCHDFSIVMFYSDEEYQYPCDRSIKKVTTSKHWYIIKDILKNN